jgi:hypothetical protein
MLTHFKNLSCYEEFEIQCSLAGISKIDILKEIGHQIDNYYYFISEDGIFNWFDLEGNHTEDPGILKILKEEHIPGTITKCIIPDSVISICKDTFFGCKLLKEIIIPNSVENIGEWAFCACKSLTSITIPNSITYISHEVFKHCTTLKEVFIPSSVISIGVGAFCCCKSLEKIVIPDSVTNIRYNAFSFCKSLKEVIFKGKTLEEVKQMEKYPFGINDESVIKCEV